MRNSPTASGTPRSRPSSLRALARALIAVALASPLGTAPSAAAPLRHGLGMYSLFQAGVEVGTEEFGIFPGTGDTLWIRSEIISHAPGETTAVVNASYVKTHPELALDRNSYRLLRYHYLGLTRGQLEEVDVTLGNGQLVERGRSVSITEANQVTPVDLAVPWTDGVVLDNLVISHFYGLIARYDRQAGGTQSFTGFIPARGQLQPVYVADRGPAPLATTNGRVATRLFFVRIGRTPANLWVDDSLRIVRATLPFEGVEARLKDYTGRPWTDAEPVVSTVSRPVTIAASGFTLDGVVERPAQGSELPGIILVPGLGQRTRDGDVKDAIVQMAPYKRLSAALARAGYAVLRYDSRGVGRSGGDPDRVTLDERAADVRAAARALAKQKGVDKRRLVVVAADVGALGAALAVDRDVAFRGAILLGPPGDPIDSVLTERVLATPYLPDERMLALQEVKRLQEMLAGTEQWGDWGGARLFLPAYRELASRPPADLVTRLACPVVIVAGGQDLDVPAGSSARLADALRAAGMADVHLAEYPLLDHFLMPVEPGTGYTGLADAARDLDPEVMRYLVGWLDEKVGKGERKRS